MLRPCWSRARQEEGRSWIQEEKDRYFNVDNRHPDTRHPPTHIHTNIHPVVKTQCENRLCRCRCWCWMRTMCFPLSWCFACCLSSLRVFAHSSLFHLFIYPFAPFVKNLWKIRRYANKTVNYSTAICCHLNRQHFPFTEERKYKTV